LDSTCTDGSGPATLLQANNGSLYGITENGGTYGSGTVFKVTAAGKLTTVYNFCARRNCGDGEVPVQLVEANGEFYGVTSYGGANNYGTFFKITTGGQLTTLASFTSNATQPTAGLMQGADGNFYGTNSGTVQNFGGIIKIASTGEVSTLYTFCAQGFPCPNGSVPFGALVQAADGNFYGTTYAGGAYDDGTVFQLTAAGDLTTLYSFCAAGVPTCPDGAGPFTGLIQATDGNLYGTTQYGGSGSNPDCFGDDCGVLFKITTAGVLTPLYDFCTQAGKQCPDGFYLVEPLFQATNGSFYGTTVWGGTGGSSIACSAGCGTVYSVSVGLGSFVEANPGSSAVGAVVNILGNNLTGTTSVTFNGTPATYTVVSSTYIKATVPTGATSGTVEVTTPGGMLSSNVSFQVLP
jgi:uncharacterized repeat protein (TIGR03803 family)